MTLREQIDSDLKDAMRARDQLRMDTIRSIKSAVMYKETEGEGKTLDDAGIQKVVQGLIKQRRDAAEQFRAGGRPELAEKEEKELSCLQAYLPKQLSEAEVEAIVAAAIQETGAKAPKDMGSVMKAAQPKIAGRADGKLVSEIVKRKLSAG